MLKRDLADSDPSLERLPAGLVRPRPDPVLAALTEGLLTDGGDGIGALLLYGSRVQESTPSRWSAYDFLVILDRYGAFYRALAAAGRQRRPAWLLTALSWLLPPNIISYRTPTAPGAIAKCAVIRRRHFERALGPWARDHFLKGRAIQRLALLWCRSEDDRQGVLAALRAARKDTARWVRPFLSEAFTVEGFARAMLEVSYRGEIRPERADRVEEVFGAQRDSLMAIAHEALAWAEERGAVVEADGRYRWTSPPGPLSRALRSAYFLWSKARATSRWFKHMVTFEAWLDYILKKLERRAGLRLEVTERERRWPIILLWPKLFYVLRTLKEESLTVPPEPEEQTR